MIECHDYNLLKHNTFGIDAKCRRFLEYASTDEAVQLVGMLTEADRPLLIIGQGSNLLLTGDYQGTVITPQNRFEAEILTQPSASGQVLLRCWAGTTFDDVVEFAVTHGLYGAENLSLIPGEVGASAVQNIGAYGAEACDIIHHVEAVEITTGRVLTFRNADCAYSYRQSRFKREWKDRFLITHVTYQLSRTFAPRLDYGNIRARLAEKQISHPTARELRETIIEIRRAKLPDPEKEGNAGSFFMNPVVSRAKYEELEARFPGLPHYTVDADHEKIPAGWMIDQCGWKGRSLGRAGVHDRQALVLVNRGGATGQEIVQLCEAVRRDVFSKFGIEIHPEVNIR